MNPLLFTTFVERLKTYSKNIAVIGDVCLDEYYNVQTKRLSPEFPIPVMLSGSDQPDRTMPGGAANVAYQLKQLNTKPVLYSLYDEYANDMFFKYEITAPPGPNGFVHTPLKKRFYSGDSPMYRWDVEVPNYGLSESLLHEETQYLKSIISYKKFDAVIFSDYNKGLFNSELIFYVGMDVPNHVLTVVDPKSKDCSKWIGCNVFKPNAQEAFELSGKKDWKDQCDFFMNNLNCDHVVITAGGEGVFGKNGNEYFTYCPNQKVEVVSVIGAGDSFASFLTVALLQGFTIQEATAIAYEAGSIYVQRRDNPLVKPIELLKEKSVSPTALLNEPNLIFTNGCFDFGLTKAHVELLKYAKSLGGKLVVGINSDWSVAENKGSTRPIMPLEERIAVLSALECVDFVVSFNEKTPYELIKKLNPKKIVKGGDYRPEDVVGNDLAEVVIFPLVDSCSTTEKLARSTE